MKKFMTVCICAAAILFCVLIGSLIGKGLAAHFRVSSSSASTAVSSEVSASSAASASATAEAVSFSITVPEGFSATTEPDMDAAWLHADSSEILLKTYDITAFAGGMGALTQEQMLALLSAAYEAEYSLTPDFTVNSYTKKDVAGHAGYALDVDVKTHRGEEEYRQLLFAISTDTGTMELWSFTDESKTEAHMAAFQACIDTMQADAAQA